MLVLYQHILGKTLINTPYKILAGDVQKDEVLNISDVLIMRKVILGEREDFVNVDSWFFVPESHTFTDPANPWE